MADLIERRRAQQQYVPLWESICSRPAMPDNWTGPPQRRQVLEMLAEHLRAAFERPNVVLIEDDSFAGLLHLVKKEFLLGQLCGTLSAWIGRRLDVSEMAVLCSMTLGGVADWVAEQNRQAGRHH